MTRRFRFVVLLALALLAVTVAGATAAQPGGEQPPPRISLSVSAPTAGSSAIVVSGRVTPASTRGQVAIQVLSAGRWRRLVRVPLRHGHFKRRTALPAGTLSARVRAALFVDGRQVAVSGARPVRSRAATMPPPTGPPAPAPVPVPMPTAPPTPAPTANPLSAASLMATIASYSSRPDHLSGTIAGAAALDEFQAALAASGLRLGEQAFTYPRFTPTAVALSADGTAVPRAVIAPLLYSGTTGPTGVTATLFNGGTGEFDKSQVAGKIVVFSTTYPNNAKSPLLIPAIEEAVEGKAAGFVAVTGAVGDFPKWEDTNARTKTGPLPVLMVGKRSGAAVIAAAAAGKTGTLTLAAETAGTSCDRDVWGELEGADPSRRVFVASPATSFTPSASEHGSGIAITIGLARHYAALPKPARPETLVFMALGGHEVGWLGLQALLNSPQASFLQNADAYIHLGSALGAPTAKEEPDGTIVTTATPDPTGRLHESENPLLVEPVKADFAAAGVPTPETPPFSASGGEQTNAYAAGIPTASFSGASLYFHTAGDLPSTVDPSILERDADAFRRTVDTITAIPAGELKAENAHAAELGSKINAAERAPSNPTLGSPGGSLGGKGVGGPPATTVAACP